MAIETNSTDIPPAVRRVKDAYDGLTFDFWRSRFAVGTLFVALLLNRIQHIVHPIGRPQNPTHLAEDLRDPNPAPSSQWQRWSSYVVPMDFSRLRTRFVLRLPSIVLMARITTLTLIFLLQNQDIGGWVPKGLEQWAGALEMREVCWMAFSAVAVTLATTAMNNGLDGSGSGRTALTFNLVDFSIMLHYLSSPATHPKLQGEGPSRPDIHGILSLLAPLLDLTIYNTFGVAKRYSHHRLPPTALSFTIILFSHWLSVIRDSHSYFARSGLILASLDTFMLLSIFITWSLKALTCVLLNGGLGESFWTLPASMTLRWEDDFRTILLKLILASFSTTSVSGFANELPAINAKAEASVEIMPDGTVLVNHSAEGGFGLEIKRVTVEEPEPSDPIFGGWGEAGRWRLLGKLGRSLGSLVLYLVRPLYRDAWAGLRSTLGLWRQNGGRQVVTAQPRPQVVDESDEEDGENDYQKFLRGVSVASEGDTDYIPRASIEPEDVDVDSDSEAEEPENSQALFDPQDASDAPILLSHFLDSQNHPMTRLRYRGVSKASPMSTPMSTPSKRPQVKDDEEKQVCIVCYSEPRAVVCWPCRCLSLCDDCRSSLATLPLNQHLCPTCRVPVQGYSRIFKP